MKIECPKCHTGGKLDPTRVPDTGANIRCPSCGAVFFVEKPKAASDEGTSDAASADSSAAASEETPATAGTTPDSSGSGSQKAAAESSTAAADEAESAPGSAAAAADESSAAEGPAASTAEGSPASSGAEAATPSTPATTPVPAAAVPKPAPETVPGRPTGPSLGGPSGANPAFRMTVSQPAVGDSVVGAGAEAPAKTTPPPTEARIPRRSSSASNARIRRLASGSQAVVTHPWKVRNSSGMIYDFPDTRSVKGWLEGRTSHLDLELSHDGGDTWKAITAFDDLVGIQPRGFRSSSLRLNEGLQRAAADSLKSGQSSRTSSGTGASGTADYRSGAARAAAKADERAKGDSKASPASKDKKGNKKDQKRKKSNAPRTKRMRDQEAEIERSRRNFRIGTGVAILICCAVAWVVFKKNEARQTLPDTPAGAQMAWVIDALNGEATDMASAEIEQHFVAASLSVAGEGDVGRGARLILNELRFWHEQYPYYQFDQIVGRATPSYLEAELATSIGEAGVVGLEVQRDPPHQVISLWIRPIE